MTAAGLLHSCHLLQPAISPYPGFGLLTGLAFHLPSVMSPIFLSLGSLLTYLLNDLLPAYFNLLLTSGHLSALHLPAPLTHLPLSAAMSVLTRLSYFAIVNEHCLLGLNSTYPQSSTPSGQMSALAFPELKSTFFFSGILRANHFLPSSSF